MYSVLASMFTVNIFHFSELQSFPEKGVEVTVWDRNESSSDHRVGGVCISLAHGFLEGGELCEEWFELETEVCFPILLCVVTFLTFCLTVGLNIASASI